jgi:hypothetical protein
MAARLCFHRVFDGVAQISEQEAVDLGRRIIDGRLYSAFELAW